MKIRKYSMLTSAIVLTLSFSGAAFASESDEVKITVDHPQAISVSNPVNVSGAAGAVLSTSWTISSNNGFDIDFSGTSHNDAGVTVNYPNFDKADVNASGAVIPNSYDTLDTRWGVMISGHQSTQTGTQWGGASNPTAQDATQGGDILVSGGPNTAIGTIMTGDNTGTADVTLYVRGTNVDGASQSGNYSATVSLIVSADEQLAASTPPPPVEVTTGNLVSGQTMNTVGQTLALGSYSNVISATFSMKALTSAASSGYFYLKNAVGDTVGTLHAEPSNYGTAGTTVTFNPPIQVSSVAMYSWWNNAQAVNLTLTYNQ